MHKYKYLIIGGGMTADAAVNGIREIDLLGSIGMVSMESDPPYNRPPLSKGLWKGKPIEKIWRNNESENVELLLGRRIVSLDPDNFTAEDDQGEQYQAEKILLATGGVPRRFPFEAKDVIYYRTLEDYRNLSDLSKAATEFAVIGGGFIGSEIAAALNMTGHNVTMIFPEDGIGANIFPPDLSQHLNEFYRKKGVAVLAGETVTSIRKHRKQHVVSTLSSKRVTADGIIAGIGILPNLKLARPAGLHVRNGILVDEQLVSSVPGIYAAGDVAEFFNPALDKRLLVQHEDNANNMGRQAGRNMAGASEPYHYLPYFFSDLFELGYEAIGELDSRLVMVADWSEPFQKGIVYYFKKNRICGVLLWNVWDKVPAARELIAKPGPFHADDLKKANKSPAWRITY
jgi:3-phenylpropionate/trans-cinnamate dioxygenase ferredoxin reductase subunit